MLQNQTPGGILADQQVGRNPRQGLGHRRQKEGVNTTSRVNSSSRPSSITAVHTQVWKSFSTAKVEAGPTWPRPGPMLLMQAMVAEKAVRISAPEAASSMVDVITVTPYISI